MTRRARYCLAAGGALAVLGSLAVAIGLREAVARPQARRLELSLREWPADQPSLTIALIADIHLGNGAMDARRLASIVDDVDSVRPDLVLIAGDFVIGHDARGAVEHAAALREPLSRLRAPLGVIAVLGNHDHWTAPAAIRSALAQAGVTVLTNRAVRRGPLAVIGVDDPFSHHDDLAAAMASWKQIGGVPILVAHSPDLVSRLGRDIPLVLTGHTHCGQIVLPWIGPPLARSPLHHWRPLYDPRYRCGVIRDAGRTVVVTAGVGSGTMPLRLGAPPDWWLIRAGPPLRSRQEPQGTKVR